MEPLAQTEAVQPVMHTPEHLAERPAWDCGVCGQPWPCAPARERLIRQYGRGTALAMLAWQYLEEAVRDLPDGPPGVLFERFVRWTR